MPRSQPPSDRRAAGTLILLLTAAIWGFSFVAQRAGMEHVGPFTFNAVRFLLGCLVLLPFLRSRRGSEHPAIARSRSIDRWGMALLGIVLFASATLQQIGLLTTSAGEAGFITGLYVILVPIYGIFLGQRVRSTVWIGAILALGGFYLLAGGKPEGFGVGEGLLLAGAFGWAAHVQLAAWLLRRVGPFRIAVVQTAMCGGLSLIVALWTESFAISAIRAALPSLLFAGVLSVGMAYTLQLIGQRWVDPSRAGIVISLEAVFAILGGWAVLEEPITGIVLAGGGLMLVGMFLSQIEGRQNRALDVAGA